jgi:hypothetical protein
LHHLRALQFRRKRPRRCESLGAASRGAGQTSVSPLVFSPQST